MNTDNLERTEDQIRAELEAVREQMTQTVDELFGRVQPDYIVGQAKDNARAKVDELKSLAAQTIDDAKDGDSEALKRIGYVAAGVAAFVGLVVVKIVRSKH